MRHRTEKEISKRLKVNEIMSKVNLRYVATSNTDSESSDCNLYVNNINESERGNVEQEPVSHNGASSSEDEINDKNDSLLSISNDESNDDWSHIDFVENNDERNVLEFENDAQKEEYIETIREWALEAGYLSMKKLNNLLNRLSVVFPQISRNYKTLLRTPVHINIIEFDDECKFWYKSILYQILDANLNAMDMKEYL